MTASSAAHHSTFIFLLRHRSTQILIYLHVSLYLCCPPDPTVQEPLENRWCFGSMYPWWSAQSLMCGQFSSADQSYPTLCNPWTAANQASLSITNSCSWHKLKSIELVIPSNYLIRHHPLLLPSIFPSIKVFSKESALHIRWPKYWSFSFSITPSNEYSGLISFRTDWFDLLAVQGTLQSLSQHHSSKASILWHSAFFMLQLSHPYMTTGKTIALADEPSLAK